MLTVSFRQSSIRIVLLAVWSALLFVAAACAQAPAEELVPKVEPLYTQCKSLDGAASESAKVEAALAGMKSEAAEARVTAAGQLGRSCDRRAVEPLLKMAREDREVEARVAAIKALGELGAPETIDPLLELIDDPDWRIKLPLSRTLCSFEQHRSSYDVLNRLVNAASLTIASDGELYARCQGILMINQLRDEGFSRKAVLFLFSLFDLKQESQRRIVEATARELGKTRNGGYQLLGILQQSLNPHVRRQAAYWIGELGIEMAAESLVRVAAEDRDARVRQAATDALAKLKSDKRD